MTANQITSTGFKLKAVRADKNLVGWSGQVRRIHQCIIYVKDPLTTVNLNVKCVKCQKGTSCGEESAMR